MKTFLNIFAIAALVFAPMAASAQQLILGSGATSASSSGVSVVGNIGSGAALAGIATTNLNVQQNQTTSGLAFGATAGPAFSIAGSTTTASGSSNVNSTSAALGIAAAGNGGAVTSINGSDAAGFGGFGFQFP
jgi:hypothetical protein